MRLIKTDKTDHFAYCIYCRKNMILIDYGRIFKCECGNMNYRYPKPKVLQLFIDDLWR